MLIGEVKHRERENTPDEMVGVEMKGIRGKIGVVIWGESRKQRSSQVMLLVDQIGRDRGENPATCLKREIDTKIKRDGT